MTGKTIVYLPNWLGDMVMAVPFLHALRMSLDGELWAIGKSNAVHIYNGLNLFDRFIPLDSKGLVPFLDMVSFLRACHFRRSISLPHSFRSALLFYIAGIRDRIGYARNNRGFMLNFRVPEGPDVEPTVEHYLRIIDNLGGKRLLDAPLLLVTEDEEHKFDKRFTDIHTPYAAFIVGAEYGPSKCWPEEYFARLGDMIVERLGMKVYILPGRNEENMARKVVEQATRKDSVEVRLMGVRELKACLSRAAVCVTNDTGPRHISAGLSTPTVVMVGPMDERYTSYPNPCVRHIVKDVPCRPCNRKKCDGNHECMKGLTPEEVFTTLEDLLAKTENQASRS